MMENEPDIAMELAVKFDCLSHDRDAASYYESVESMDENVLEIAGVIRQGDTRHTMMPCGANKKKKPREKPAGRASLKERLCNVGENNRLL